MPQLRVAKKKIDLKCAENHLIYQCKKPRSEPAKCANCQARIQQIRHGARPISKGLRCSISGRGEQRELWHSRRLLQKTHFQNRNGSRMTIQHKHNHVHALHCKGLNRLKRTTKTQKTIPPTPNKELKRRLTTMPQLKLNKIIAYCSN